MNILHCTFCAVKTVMERLAFRSVAEVFRGPVEVVTVLVVVDEAEDFVLSIRIENIFIKAEEQHVSEKLVLYLLQGCTRPSQIFAVATFQARIIFRKSPKRVASLAKPMIASVSAVRRQTGRFMYEDLTVHFPVDSRVAADAKKNST